MLCRQSTVQLHPLSVSLLGGASADVTAITLLPATDQGLALHALELLCIT